MLFLLSMQGINIWNRGSIHVHTSSSLWNSLVVYVNYFAFELQKWSWRVMLGKPAGDEEAQLAWKHKCWVVETEKRRETRGGCLAQALLSSGFHSPWQFCRLVLHLLPTCAPLGRAETLSEAPPGLWCAQTSGVEGGPPLLQSRGDRSPQGGEHMYSKWTLI